MVLDTALDIIGGYCGCTFFDDQSMTVSLVKQFVGG